MEMLPSEIITTLEVFELVYRGSLSLAADRYCCSCGSPDSLCEVHL